VLGIGDKLFAVPFQEVRFNHGKDEMYYVLDISKEKLEQAPGFDKSHWPDFADANWKSQVDSYYRDNHPGTATRPRLFAPTAPGPPSLTLSSPSILFNPAKKMLFSSLVTLALSSSALATVFITNPTASTTFSAAPGKQATVTWQEDGQAPTLKDFGDAKVSIYVGNAQQQTSKQLVATTNVAATNSVTFSIDPSMGESSDQYFIRMESVNCKDPKNPQYPCLAFSAKFTISDMTGAFTVEEKQQIAGQTTAPLGGSPAPTPAPQNAAGGASSAAPSGGSAPTKPQPSAPSGSKALSSPSPSAKNNGASSYGVSSKVVFGALFAAAVALF
jgi:hypothetical protein